MGHAGRKAGIFAVLTVLVLIAIVYVIIRTPFTKNMFRLILQRHCWLPERLVTLLTDACMDM